MAAVTAGVVRRRRRARLAALTPRERASAHSRGVLRSMGTGDRQRRGRKPVRNPSGQDVKDSHGAGNWGSDSGGGGGGAD
jgi:hypothetical protein